ncbi:DUF4139 domain-containing protein, partial [Crocinitomicaceae bacterium]|nr:DUF4139 domain-containing protein [Crocinitomicaceae bacterium]
MKKIFAILVSILIATNTFAEDEKIVKSKIEKVTVYSQGAQVYRKASYSINKGVTQIIIDGVSNNIDANSLQVNATGSSIILDTKYSIFYPEKIDPKLEGLPLKIRRKISILQDSISRQSYDVRVLQDEIDVYFATKKILANNGAIRGQGKVNDSIPLLKDAIEYYTKKMMEINKKLQVLNKDKTILNLQLTGMNLRLQSLRNFENENNLNPKPKEPSYRITVTFKANQQVSGKLEISYLVNNAGWTPLYDLRSDISSSKINLNYKANVHQNTGVDWTDIRLNISTNNPYQNKTKPTLHPWYVDYNIYKLKSQKNKEVRNSYGEKRKAEKLNYNAPATESMVMNDAEEDAIYSNEFVEVVDNMISAEFRIDLPYSIKSNNQKHMVLIKNVDLEANYKYYTVPKVDKSVYLVAQLSKLDELQLVPAKANIFFDGTYMGETYIDPTTKDDTLFLSLGKDPNIITKKTLLKKETKNKIVGQKMEKTYAYSIEVKNLKSRAIRIVVQDQIPITQNSDIEIEALETSRGKFNERTGMLEWEFTLKPKAEKDIKLTYEVK